MPQGVAGVIGKHEIQKATTDSSHHNIQADRKLFFFLLSLFWKWLAGGFQMLPDKAYHHHSCLWLRSLCTKLGRRNMKSQIQKRLDNWLSDI